MQDTSRGPSLAAGERAEHSRRTALDICFHGSIGIAWDDVSDEAQYFLERRLINPVGLDLMDMGIVLAADQTSFSDQDLKRSHTLLL